MKKSKLLAVLPVAVSALVLASCGPERQLSDKGFIREFTKIELRTTAGAESIKVLQNMAEKFMKDVEPNVTVEVKKYSGSYTALANDIETGFSAGTHPDMAMVYPDAVASFIDNGFAYNLESYMNNEEYGWSEDDFDDLVPSFLEEGRQYKVNGTYSLPMSKSTEVMYYHDSIIGLTIPNVVDTGEIRINETYLENLTWEEFFGTLCPSIVAYTETSAGANLISKDGTAGNKEWAVLGYDSDDNLFITLSQQYGIPYTSVDKETGEGEFLFNNAQAKEKMYEWNEYAKKDYVLSAGSTGFRANDYFKANQVLFSIGSTAGSKYQYNAGDEISVCRIPQAENKDKKVILQGPSMAFLSHKDNEGRQDNNRKLASWLFYKYMAEPENTLNWSLSADYMPIRQSGYQSDEYKEFYDESQYSEGEYGMLTSRIANYVGSLTNDYFTTPAFKGTTQSREGVGAIMTKALTKTSSKAEIDAQFQSSYEEAVKAAK